MEKMTLASMDIAEEKREALKRIFPEVFTEERIDFDQLKRVLGEWVDPDAERFGLNWPGKAECMKIIQKLSAATLKPVRNESVNFDETENVFIEGENLEVLKLLQKAYFGKIKMIYIDPPYNTGKEFIYPDKYCEELKTYLAYTGQVDEDGRKFSTNTDTDGRYHSRWLNMMYPRLYLAYSLLREDGVIFISIDDNEVVNLRTLCDLIFGEENFVIQLVWKSRQIVDSRNKTNASTDHEYVLVYAKNSEEAKILGKEIDTDKYSNPDNDLRGPWMSNSILGLATASQRPNLHYPISDPNRGIEYSCPRDTGWRYSRETMEQKISDDRIVFPKSPNGRPREKKFLSEIKSEFTGLSSVIPEDVGYTLNGTREVRDLIGGRYFDFPKPASLIKLLVKQGALREGDIIIDFFAGSATTAHAVMQLNAEDGGSRKYICVQLPEPTDKKSEAYKTGYETIADIGKERIRRAAKQIEDEQNGQLDLNGNGKLDLGFKAFKLDQSNFRVWDGTVDDADALIEQLELHVDHISTESSAEDILYEILLNAGFPLTTKVEKRNMAGKEVFSIADGKVLICLEQEVTSELIDALANANPSQVICLDAAFQRNDQLKVNAVLTFKSHAEVKETEMVFKTV